MNATVKQLSLVALVMALEACGGAPLAQSPASDRAMSDGEPATVEEAQAQIARARERLASATPPASPPAPMSTSPADVPQPSAEPSMPSSQQGPSAGPKKSEPPCSEPCRAVASMRRAVAALCRLTGDDDGRCREARQTLSSSTSQVGPCACPG